jgi:hypothetical protein
MTLLIVYLYLRDEYLQNPKDLSEGLGRVRYDAVLRHYLNGNLGYR